MSERVAALEQELPGLHLSFAPDGVLLLQPPAEQPPDEVTNVRHRSPLEVYLGGLQSVGSWRSYLGYSMAAAVVVWVGLYTGNVPLLVGAALVATPQTVAASEVSMVALLLPLVAGAVGATYLFQSERNSLVTGAGAGVLVASSLVIPAGVIGVATALRDWGMAQSGIFLLVLQLVGITLAGAVVFRLYGLSAQGRRYAGGRQGVVAVVLTLLAALLAAVLVWQFWPGPELQRASVAERARREVYQVVAATGQAAVVEADVRLTRAGAPNQDSLLAVVYVQRLPGAQGTSQALRTHLIEVIQAALRQQGERSLAPLVDVVVLTPLAPSAAHLFPERPPPGRAAQPAETTTSSPDSAPMAMQLVDGG